MNTFFGRFRNKSTSPLESELRAARPQPPKRLVDSISSMVTPRSGARPARLRLAFAGGLTVALVAVAGATGGLSYAATAVAHVASAVDITSSSPAPDSAAPVRTSACSVYAVAPIITSISPSAAFAGQTVHIKGNHFSGASAVTSVTFSPGVSAAFSIVSNTKVNAIVPSGAVTGSVTVSNCKGSAGGAFKVKAYKICVVPNIIGMTIANAKATILASPNCHVGVVTKKTVGPKPHNYIVIKQGPKAGKTIISTNDEWGAYVSFTAKG